MRLSKKGNWEFVPARNGLTCTNGRTAQSLSNSNEDTGAQMRGLPGRALQHSTTMAPSLNFADADRMSVVGHNRRSQITRHTSGLHPTADQCSVARFFALG